MSKKKTDKKYGVLVTSAINAKFSVYSPEERLNQTLETIASVRERIPNAFICLTDCGVPGLDEETVKKLNVDNFIDFSGDETVNWIRDNITEQDVVKNLTELCVIAGFFEMAHQQGWFKNYDRVFKVSGRYTLTERFKIEEYENPLIGDKYVVSKRMLSQFLPGVTGVDQQYMLRVYSMGAKRILEFSMILEDMTNHMQDRVNNNGYIDIEHLWYKFLPRKDVIEFDRTGVTGHIAPNGTLIEN